jgi:hypothetical protein
MTGRGECCVALSAVEAVGGTIDSPAARDYRFSNSNNVFCNTKKNKLKAISWLFNGEAI